MAREVRLRSWIPAAAHAADMVGLIHRAEVEALRALAPALRRDDLSDALLALGGVESSLWRWLSNSRISTVVERTGERARSRADRHWAREIGRAVGHSVAVDTRPSRELLQAWIATNTARIQGLRAETLERLRSDLETAVLSQVRPQELAAKWEREGLPTRNGTLRGRATVIARDQLGTLAAQIAESQQRGLGLVEYMWDARPGIPRKRRPIHAGRHGGRYRWDGAPPGGHPGAPIACRCRAVAVVPLDRLREIEGPLFPE